jgi:hypothetical protein
MKWRKRFRKIIEENYRVDESWYPFPHIQLYTRFAWGKRVWVATAHHSLDRWGKEEAYLKNAFLSSTKCNMFDKIGELMGKVYDKI